MLAAELRCTSVVHLASGGAEGAVRPDYVPSDLRGAVAVLHSHDLRHSLNHVDVRISEWNVLCCDGIHPTASVGDVEHCGLRGGSVRVDCIADVDWTFDGH